MHTKDIKKLGKTALLILRRDGIGELLRRIKVFVGKKVFRKKKRKRRIIFEDGMMRMTNPCENLAEGSRNRQEREKKSILFLLSWMTFGGAESVVYNLSAKLKGKYNISFVTGLESRNEWEKKFKEISDDVYHLPDFFSDEKEYLEFLENFIRIRNVGIAHIFHNNIFYPLLPPLKEKFPDLNVVSTVFNLENDYFADAVKFDAYIDTHTTDNGRVAQAFLAKGIASEKVRQIVNGVDCRGKFNRELFDRGQERKELGIAPDELAVFFVGRLAEEKCPEIFVATAEKAMAQGENLKFFMIGDGPLRKKVERLVRKSRYRRIKFLGYRENIPKYLSAADIFVLSSRIEGFPLSIIEAMAMRVCVIASDVGGVSEAIKDGKTGFLVPSENPGKIAEKIALLAHDKKLMEKIAQQGRYAVEEKFSTDAMAEQYRKIYEA